MVQSFMFQEKAMVSSFVVFNSSFKTIEEKFFDLKSQKKLIPGSSKMNYIVPVT